MNEEYEFFWSGPFSQWYPSKFTENSVTFATAEQYMMYHKALLFMDFKIAEQILNTEEPHEQKALGRLVKGFNADTWNAVAKSIVYQGNYLKFTQNEFLYSILMDTEDKILVEASPYDTIWGIGLNEKDAKVTPVEQWKGTNWLGEVLTKLKNDLKNGN